MTYVRYPVSWLRMRRVLAWPCVTFRGSIRTPQTRIMMRAQCSGPTWGQRVGSTAVPPHKPRGKNAGRHLRVRDVPLTCDLPFQTPITNLAVINLSTIYILSLTAECWAGGNINVTISRWPVGGCGSLASIRLLASVSNGPWVRLSY
jgi:hypothetical protein